MGNDKMEELRESLDDPKVVIRELKIKMTECYELLSSLPKDYKRRKIMEDKLKEIVDDLEILVKKAKGNVPHYVYDTLLKTYMNIFKFFTSEESRVEIRKEV